MSPEWALVIATIVLAIVAVFQDRLRALVTKPRLKLIINLNSTDSQKTYYRYANDFFEIYYIRFRVKNYGKVSARNVEVLLSDAYKLNESNNEWEIVTNLSQDNLIWNTFGEGQITRYYWDYISPNTFQYINFAKILDPLHRFEDETKRIPNESGRLEIYPKNEILVSLQVFMRSINKNYLLSKGTYRFKLTVGSSNAKKYECNVKLEFNGKWDKNPEIMLRDNIQLEMLS